MQSRDKTNQPEVGHQPDTYVCSLQGLLEYSHHLLLEGHFVDTLGSTEINK